MTDRAGSERDAVIARLCTHLGDQFTEEDIASAVHAAFDALLAQARFHVYLPVLAERSAIARLVDGAQQDAAPVELRSAADPSPLGLEGNPQTPPRGFSGPPGTLQR